MKETSLIQLQYQIKMKFQSCRYTTAVTSTSLGKFNRVYNILKQPILICK